MPPPPSRPRDDNDSSEKAPRGGLNLLHNFRFGGCGATPHNLLAKIQSATALPHRAISSKMTLHPTGEASTTTNPIENSTALLCAVPHDVRTSIPKTRKPPAPRRGKRTGWFGTSWPHGSPVRRHACSAPPPKPLTSTVYTSGNITAHLHV